MNFKHDKITNQNIQKTLTNLLSTFIATVCQQIIEHDKSIDIFGSVSICVDNGMDLSIRLNETFVKDPKPVGSQSLSADNDPDMARIIDIVETTRQKYENEVNLNELQSTFNSINEGIIDILETSQKESNNITTRRRRRKPIQTFKHVSLDDFEANRRFEQDDKIISSDSNDKSCKTEMSCPNACNSNEVGNVKELKDIKVEKYENEVMDGLTDKCLDLSTNNRIDAKTNNKVFTTNDQKKKVNKPVVSCSIGYRCNICSRLFKRKFCLKRHKRIHDKIKKYNCNLCGLGFNFKSGYKRHMINHHPTSPESTMSANSSNVALDLSKNNSSNTSVSNRNVKSVSTTPTKSASATATSKATQNEPKQMVNNNPVYPGPLFFVPPFALPSYPVAQNNSLGAINSSNTGIFNQKYLYPPNLFNSLFAKSPLPAFNSLVNCKPTTSEISKGLSNSASIPNLINVTSTLPNVMSTLPNITGTIPNVWSPIPNAMGMRPNTWGTMSNAWNTMTNATGAMSNATNTIPNAWITVPKPWSMIPNAAGTMSSAKIPNAMSTIPNIWSSMPNSMSTMTNPVSTMPNISNVLPSSAKIITCSSIPDVSSFSVGLNNRNAGGKANNNPK